MTKISKYCVIIFIITRDEQILCDYKNNHTIFRYFLKYGVIIFIITRDETFSFDYFCNHTGRQKIIDQNNHTRWFFKSHMAYSTDYFHLVLINFKSHKKKFGESLRVIKNIVHEIFEHNQLMSWDYELGYTKISTRFPKNFCPGPVRDLKI